MEKHPITIEGHKKLQKELEQLVKVERKKIIEDIQEARAHGDLKENAEYHAAKEKQGHVEGRIQYINSILANVDVIDVQKINLDKVVFGATVVYEDVETGEETKWKIVGHTEFDIESRTISVQSPIARGLLNKQVGDIAVIRRPKGDIEVEIISIEYI